MRIGHQNGMMGSLLNKLKVKYKSLVICKEDQLRKCSNDFENDLEKNFEKILESDPNSNLNNLDFT